MNDVTRRLDKLENISDKHGETLADVGKSLALTVQALEVMVKQQNDPERGTIALHNRVKRLEKFFLIGFGMYLAFKGIFEVADRVWPHVVK